MKSHSQTSGLIISSSRNNHRSGVSADSVDPLNSHSNTQTTQQMVERHQSQIERIVEELQSLNFEGREHSHEN